MATQPTNGTIGKSVFFWVMGVFLTLGLVVAGAMMKHTERVGHVGLVERVEGVHTHLEEKIDSVQKDVEEIQRDVKVLLQRSK
jgi:hypothetical protein